MITCDGLTALQVVYQYEIEQSGIPVAAAVSKLDLSRSMCLSLSMTTVASTDLTSNAAAGHGCCLCQCSVWIRATLTCKLMGHAVQHVIMPGCILNKDYMTTFEGTTKYCFQLAH